MPATTVQLVLGHGASAGAASMKPWIDALARRGVSATAPELPRSNPDKAVDVFRQAHGANPAAALGGHSFGGRMASLLAAEAAIPALVLLSYPLHRPGHPDELRTAHWSSITCPVLLLSGERDPFAQLPLLRREVHKLKRAQLFTFPTLGHGLVPVVDDAADKIVEFLRG